MINIFNLFLILFTFWIILIFVNHHISWPYIFLGMVVSIAISVISWKIKIINKNTKFLFLNFGFYKHFFLTIFFSFFKSLALLLRFSLTTPTTKSVFYYFPLKKKQSMSDLSVFISTLTLMPGIFCVGIKKRKMIIHILDKKYFQKDKIEQIYDNLYKIDDNRLI